MNTVADFFDGGALAVVGASTNPRAFGNAAYKTLKEHGVQVYPVNPNYAEVEGDHCYKSLSELPTGVTAAVFVLTPAAAVKAVDEARAAGINRIWFQQGGDYRQAAKLAEEAGMQVVKKKCILLYSQPVTGVHAFHRFFVKLFGRL